jgi:U3 small nucleolar RNA-associated protein 7
MQRSSSPSPHLSLPLSPIQGKSDGLLSKAEKEIQDKMQKYARGGNGTAKQKKAAMNIVKDKKLKSALQRAEEKFEKAARDAARAEVLLTTEGGYLETEGEMERTFKFSQKMIKQEVDMNAAKNVFDLQLNDFGPYQLDFSRNGRHCLLGGSKGHVAMLDMHRKDIVTEVHLQERVKDVCFLQNFAMFATAQKKYAYIYDNTGAEVHCLKHHLNPEKLSFLPYHWLLASVGNWGALKYQDTTTGALVAEHKTKLGSCTCMQQNPHNAVMHLGHHNGVVTFWSPGVREPLVKMYCHKGNVNGIAIDREGNNMVTIGTEGTVKVWDLRTYQHMHTYYTKGQPTSVDISQRGLLAVSYGPTVHVYKDAVKTKATLPYMTHSTPGSPVVDLHFRPFEDVLGVARVDGFSSLLIPGSGEPNYDSYAGDPFQGQKARKEEEVKMLLDKISPDMIVLDPSSIGGVRQEQSTLNLAAKKVADAANQRGKPGKEKKRQRGRSKIGRKLKRKQLNVMDEKKQILLDKLANEKQEKKDAHGT